MNLLANLPAPVELTAEIVESLEAALEEFGAAEESLEEALAINDETCTTVNNSEFFPRPARHRGRSHNHE